MSEPEEDQDIILISDSSTVEEAEVVSNDSVIVISSDCSPVKVFTPSKRSV